MGAARAGRTPSDWVERVRDGRLERREELALGLPWSPQLVERSRRATGATIARGARGSRGRHRDEPRRRHAPRVRRTPGEGSACSTTSSRRSATCAPTGRARRVLVVDVDVHQGDGTHALFAADADAFTLSVNGFRNYPFRRVAGDLDVDLPDGTGDDRYLAELARVLPEAIRRARPEVCFVLAGADPYEGDRLGRLALTKGGLRERDVLVRDALAGAGVPLCVTLAGGYAEDIRDTVEINLGTVKVFSASRS